MSADQGAVALIPPAGTAALLAPPSGDRRPIGAPAPARVWTATGLERQVFLDRTGRRRRFVGVAGSAAAILCALWLAGLVAGALGFSSLPALRSVGSLASKPAAPALRLDTRSPRHPSFKVAATNAGRHATLSARRAALSARIGHIDLD